MKLSNCWRDSQKSRIPQPPSTGPDECRIRPSGGSSSTPSAEWRLSYCSCVPPLNLNRRPTAMRALLSFGGRGSSLYLGGGPDVTDSNAVFVGQPLGDERPVARLWVAFDTEERGRAIGGQRRGDRAQVDRIEDLPQVTLSVLGRELDPRPLANPAPLV